MAKFELGPEGAEKQLEQARTALRKAADKVQHAVGLLNNAELDYRKASETIAKLQRLGFATKDFSAHQFGPIYWADLLFHELSRRSIPIGRPFTADITTIRPADERMARNVTNLTFTDPATVAQTKIDEQAEWELEQEELVAAATLRDNAIYLRGVLLSEGQSDEADPKLVAKLVSRLFEEGFPTTEEVVTGILTEAGYLDKNLTYA